MWVFKLGGSLMSDPPQLARWLELLATLGRGRPGARRQARTAPGQPRFQLRQPPLQPPRAAGVVPQRHTQQGERSGQGIVGNVHGSAMQGDACGRVVNSRSGPLKEPGRVDHESKVAASFRQPSVNV
jgi:hypothetical protein